MYAGFWKRLIAVLIDICVFRLAGLLFQALKFTLGQFEMGKDLTAWASGDDGIVFSVLLTTGSTLLVPWLYYAILESSKLQGTIGKKVMGIIVVDQHNEPVSFWRASGRYWGKLLSSVFFVGFIITGLTEKKQALHDLLAKTFVVNKKALELSKGYSPMNPNGVHMEGQQA
ncbi:RDD family protein [Paenibacillus sp. YSY-4.3]